MNDNGGQGMGLLIVIIFALLFILLVVVLIRNNMATTSALDKQTEVISSLAENLNVAKSTTSTPGKATDTFNASGYPKTTKRSKHVIIPKSPEQIQSEHYQELQDGLWAK